MSLISIMANKSFITVRLWFTSHVQYMCTDRQIDTHTHLTSMKALSVLSVGLCVMRNLMFLWHSSTGAGRFMVANGTSDL